MIFHPSLEYLARDYKLNQISVENEGKEPSPGDLKKLIDKARTDKISVIFVQREFDKKNAGTIASEINGQVVEVDPLAEDWPLAIRSIANALAKGAN
jgi:zinc transport system substrate-binding protein